MGTIMVLVFAVVLISSVFYYSLKNKTHYPNCKSNNIARTGKKNYKENPSIAPWGSPDSYHEHEYKCKNCGHLFWEKQKAIIFN